VADVDCGRWFSNMTDRALGLCCFSYVGANRAVIVVK
jgi:hypothetical protein